MPWRIGQRRCSTTTLPQMFCAAYHGAVAQLAVTLILLRALYFLRRGGETPKGFVPIAILLLFGSVTRVARLLFSWLLLKPSYWLDVTTSALLFITLKRRTVTQNSS
jgi:hypothetical protein